MQKFNIEIVGKTPYMQHRMDDGELEEWEKRRGKIIERKDINIADKQRAEFRLYKDKNKPYIPSEHIRGALINAGSYMKSKVGNSRKSMKNIVAGMFFIEPDKIPLGNSWVIDKRSAVNQNIKARIISIRPKWEKWNVKFTLLVDNDTITKETIKQLFDYAGNYCGIGSFRPTCNGMFGRFKIKSFKKVS